MISDVFLEADRTLKISESINDPFEFMRLTDSIVPMIEYSSDQALARARQLIRRVRTRKLYRFVDEILLPPGRERTVTPQDITTCQDTSIGIMLNPEDIHVAHVGLHFGMKSKNPVDEVLFFADWYVGRRGWF